MLCCLALSACGCTSPQTATPAAEPSRNPKPPGASTYQALGYLEEYSGHFVGHESDRVDRFYVNEKDVAKSFRTLLSRVARDEGLANDVREEWQVHFLN